MVAVRWYLRFNLSYRDVEELLVERGVEVDHVSVFRWVQRFTPLPVDAARFAPPLTHRAGPGDLTSAGPWLSASTNQTMQTAAFEGPSWARGRRHAGAASPQANV